MFQEMISPYSAQGTINPHSNYMFQEAASPYTNYLFQEVAVPYTSNLFQEAEILIPFTVLVSGGSEPLIVSEGDEP
jgi:hypothetical protein